MVKRKKGAEINLDSYDEPEFEDYRYVEYKQLLKKAHILNEIYKRVIEHFFKEGYISNVDST